MYAQVIVDIAHSNVDRLFTYLIPDDLEVAPGHRVLVPFGAGNKQLEGFVLRVSQAPPPAREHTSYKSIIKTLEPYTVLLDDQIQLALWLRKSYHCLIVDALRLMIPAELRGGRVREKKIRLVSLAQGLDAEAALASLQKKNGESRAPMQTEVLKLLADCKVMSVNDVASFIPNSSSAVSALIKKGFLIEDGFVTFRDPYKGKTEKKSPPELTVEQQIACERISDKLAAREGTVLLYGVTGSGKTEVYMRAISEVLDSGGTAIMLVPEIALTPQALERFKSRFEDKVAVLHSRLSPGERYDEWRRIRLGRASVVIGARSAVFAPVKELRLIIVDEEHEPSYQSETIPRYNALDAAAKRCKLSGAAMVLGSATPDVASFLRAKHEKYELVKLTKRVMELPMPRVVVADMREEFKAGNTSIFSGALKRELEACLLRKEQAILFINRRGYSTFVACRGCGYVFKCDDCDVSMTYHKSDDTVKCHYCGRSVKLPKVCPECGKSYLKYFGVGTEQVEEQLHAAFPDVRSIRMDMDTTRTKGAHAEIIAKFTQKQADVLIGTQMVAKGLDIPAVSLVGVVAADSTLHIPDYRSCERTFQLLTQVAGRAGRSTGNGRVVIQTYSPEHPAIILAARQDYDAFYDYEIAVRRASLFPPYSLFARVVFTDSDENRAAEASDEFAKGIADAIKQAIVQDGGNENELSLIFSARAPVGRRQGLYRYQTLLKLLRTKHTSKAVLAIYKYYDENRGDVSAALEVNPSDMF